MLRLNDYHALTNACAGVHDPSMMWDPVTKKYYSYCTDVYGPSIGLPEKIGIPVRSSPDLLHFTYEGTVLSDTAVRQGRNNGAYPPTQSFWAPYVEYAAGEYRLYYSATRAFGSSESRIWLATACDPRGPFENRGVVADTWGTDDTLPNAIDPHIVRDGARCYLVYGSFFGGIYLKELNAETGLPIDGDPRSLGRCIARKGAWGGPDGPEGAAVDYVPETGYFYLFLSYGWLGDTYDVRVGRSRSAAGPFLDRRGRDLVEQSPGEKLAGSYRFEALAPAVGEDEAQWRWDGLRAPGHGVPFFDPVRGHWFFVHHVRDGAAVNRFRDSFEGRVSYRRHYGMIRPMFFTNGWPTFGPEPFAGEDLSPVRVAEEADWEIVFFDETANELKRSVAVRLSPADPLLRNGVVYRCEDFENGGSTLAVTGFDDFGVAYWGKLIYNSGIIDLSKLAKG